ncbi:MAG TPA: hypothetical protein PLX84_14645 [Acidiphilium sp.]|nr:hypothetical protein [Acidiphilium sp.]
MILESTEAADSEMDRMEPKDHTKDDKRFVQGTGGSVADAETGEVLDTAFTAILYPKRINGFSREGWFAMSQSALTVLKTFKSLDDFRVLVAMLERLDFNNLILVSQSEVARDLGIDKAQVNRAVKRLITIGALLEGPKVSGHRTYRLSPDFGWKGSAKTHHQALEDEAKKLKERMAKSNIRGIVNADTSLFDGAVPVDFVPGQMDLFSTESQP